MRLNIREVFWFFLNYVIKDILINRFFELFDAILSIYICIFICMSLRHVTVT